MDLERVVARPRLIADLHALGLARGDVVMTHESVRAIGWIAGGPDEVAEAIVEAVGPEGTWMKYVGSEDGTYDLEQWPKEVADVYRASCPAFDPARTRACRAWGILCEYLRTRPGAVRSRHPDGSFAAVGPVADWLLRDHPLQDGLGPGSPLDRLLAKNGKVVLLGSPLSDVTFLHLCEYAAAIPNKRRARYASPILDERGARTFVAIEELDSSDGIARYPEGGDYFEAVTRAFVARGVGVRTGKVGFADAVLMDARALFDFGVRWMEEHLEPFDEG